MTMARKTAVKVVSRLSGQACVLEPWVSFDRPVADDDGDGSAGTSGFMEISSGRDRLRLLVRRIWPGSHIHDKEPMICCGLNGVAYAVGLRRIDWFVR